MLVSVQFLSSMFRSPLNIVLLHCFAVIMSGKGAKGLSGKGAKGTIGIKGAGDKKKPISRSARAGAFFCTALHRRCFDTIR